MARRCPLSRVVPKTRLWRDAGEGRGGGTPDIAVLVAVAPRRSASRRISLVADGEEGDSL